MSPNAGTGWNFSFGVYVRDFTVAAFDATANVAVAVAAVVVLWNRSLIGYNLNELLSTN